MKTPNREEQRKLVLQKETAGREVDRLRREALKGKPYNWIEVDALLELGANSKFPSRTTSGLIEMQRIFMKARLQSQKEKS